MKWSVGWPRLASKKSKWWFWLTSTRLCVLLACLGARLKKWEKRGKEKTQQPYSTTVLRGRMNVLSCSGIQVELVKHFWCKKSGGAKNSKIVTITLTAWVYAFPIIFWQKSGSALHNPCRFSLSTSTANQLLELNQLCFIPLFIDLMFCS